MLTLDEAMKYCEEVAEEEEKQAIWLRSREGNLNYKNCVKRAKEQRQLASWLSELKKIWDSGSCNDCKFSGHCEIQPKVGQLARYNCYHFSREDEQTVNKMELEEAANYLQELSDYCRKLLKCPSVFEEDKE